MRRFFGVVSVLAVLLTMAALGEPARAQVNAGWVPFTWSADGTCYFGAPGSFDCQSPVLTFTVNAPATVRVTDAGEAGGVWEIFCTGLPAPIVADSTVVGGDVVTDPDTAFSLEAFSKATFTLQPGTYTIAIRNVGWWDFFLGDP
ncbi:MAG: hypothetical protein QHJ73_15525, partial [Armatimonadota bacterium]|nr:hypothetical protein [Armatimonadota bacterium]